MIILPLIKTRIVQVLVGLATVVAALYIIQVTGREGILSALNILFMLAAMAWVVFSGDAWWMAVPFSVAFGGAFSMEHRFYPHEIALILSVLALIPVVVMRRTALPSRPALPSMVIGLLLLFIVNWAVSVYMLERFEVKHVGSITRAYMNGAWAVAFGVLFYRFGRLNPLLLLRLLYGAFLVRAVMVLVLYVFESWFPAVESGFMFSGATSGLSDYRTIGIPLGLLAFSLGSQASRVVAKAFHYAILSLAIVGIAVGGGRVVVGMACVVPVVWAVLRRRVGSLAVVGAVLLMLVVVLNRHPETLYRLPEGAQRALSVLVTESSTRWLDWHDRNRLSNMWHQRLMTLGMQRWTESPSAFLFGNRVEPLPAYIGYAITWESGAELAAKLGTYESGLWTVLGLTGLAGGLCYIGLFVFLLKAPFRLLRAEGVVAPVHALAFVALVGAVLWAMFSWIAGGFPSYELMMAFLSSVASEDALRSRREQEQLRLAAEAGRNR